MTDMETLGRLAALEHVIAHILKQSCIDSGNPLVVAEDIAKWALELNITMLQVTLDKNMHPDFYSGYSESLDNSMSDINDLLVRCGSDLARK